MAAKKSTYQIEIDAKTEKAVAGIKGVGDASDKAADKVDLIADALDAAAKGGKSDLDSLRKSVENTEDIFGKLERAIGDVGDGVTKADLRQVASQLDKAGISAEDLDHRLDDVAASLVQMGQNKQEAQQLTDELEQTRKKAEQLDKTDVEIDIKTDKVHAAGDDLDRATDAADRAQTGIGTLRGVTDELGGSASQFGIYGAAVVDAGETLQIFSKQLGLSEEQAAKLSSVLGGIGVAGTAAFAAVSLVMNEYNKRQTEARERTDAWAEALREGGDAAQAMTAAQRDLNKAAESRALGSALKDFLPFGKGAQDISDKLRAAGLTMEQFNQIVVGGSEVARQWAEAQAAAGNTLNPDLLKAMAEQSKAYAEAQAQAAVNADVFKLSQDQINTALDDYIAKKDPIAQFPEEFERIAKAMQDGTSPATADVDAVMKGLNITLDDAIGLAGDLADEQRDAANAAKQHKSALADLQGQMADRSSLLSLQDEFDRTKATVDEAFTAWGEGADDAEQKMRDAEQATIDLKQRVADYATEVLGLPESVTTDLLAQIDQGKAAEVEAWLTDITRPRSVTIAARVNGQYADSSVRNLLEGRGAGGTGPQGVPRSGFYQVGEFGAENIWLPKGAQIETASDTLRRERESSVGDTYTVQNYYGSLVTDRQVRKAERRAQRKGLR